MMTRLVSIMVALLTPVLGFGTANAQGISSARIIADGEQGQGFFANGGSGCILVTAAHVIGDGEFAARKITFKRDDGRESDAKVIWFSESPDDYKSSDSYDVSFLDPAQSASRPADCPALPKKGDSDPIQRNGFAEILDFDTKLDRKRIRVRIVEAHPRIIAVPVEAGTELREGLSGAPLAINNQPYGVVSGVDTRDGKAEIIIYRLDAMPEDAKKRIFTDIDDTPLGNLHKKFWDKLGPDAHAAFRGCEDNEFEECKAYGSALIRYGNENGEPWTQDAAMHFFAKACDHRVQYACSELALIYKNGPMSLRPNRARARELYDLDCTGHGDVTRSIPIACRWRDAIR